MLNPNLLGTMPTPMTTAQAPAPAPGTGSEPGAFGRELQRAEQASQDDSASKSAPEPRTDQAAETGQRGEHRSPNATERRSAAPGKATTPQDRQADGSADGTDHTAVTKATDETAPDAAATAADVAATPGADARPDIAAWVAQMAQGLELARERAGDPTRSSASPADGGSHSSNGIAGPGLPARTDAAPEGLPAERLPAAAADRALIVGVRADAQAAPTATAVLTAQADARAAFGAMLGEAVSAAAGTRPDAVRADGSPVLAAVATSAAAVGSDAATTPAAPAAVLEDSIAPSVGSREFAQALGARVAIFARDGIEHARLNLHPAELGPISLKLALDGTQVRVDMSAEAAQTRQVLEQSLPSLASALRDAGLTLSGGGIFQQARDGSSGFGDPAQAGRSRTRDGDAAAPEPVLVSRPVRLDGLVDLYA